jgi:hypothetical protein
MHTPKRRSASPHIGRLRPLNPSARTPLQSLPPCAHRGYFAKRPMAVARLGGRAQRTASFAGLAKRTQPAERNRQLSRWLAERTRQPDRSPIARPRDSRRRFVQVNRGRHIGTMWAKRTQDEVTNPIARIRQEKPPRRPAVLWPNEPERPPTSDWAEMADWAEQTQRQAAARTKPVPSPSRLNPPTRLSVEKSPVFFLLFTGKPIFALAAVVPALSLREDQSVAEPRSERTRGAKLTRQPGYFGRTNPRRQPSQHLAKRSQGAAGHACGQTNPRGTESRFRLNEPKLRTSPRLRQTNPTSNRAAVFPPNEPKVQPSAGLS